jgi:hypothetical protein
MHHLPVIAPTELMPSMTEMGPKSAGPLSKYIWLKRTFGKRLNVSRWLALCRFPKAGLQRSSPLAPTPSPPARSFLFASIYGDMNTDGKEVLFKIHRVRLAQ